MNKELEMLYLLENNSEMSQRALSSQMDLSLGTINNMIQAFEKDGVLKMRKITARKVSYDLTKKGFAVKNKMYIKYVTECFDTISDVRATFKANINKMVGEGINRFYIEGDANELLRLVKMSLFEVSRKTNIEYTYIDEDTKEELADKLSDQNSAETAVVGWETQPKGNYGIPYVNLMV